MTLSVLVPRRADGGRHDRNWAWLTRRWARLLPEAELVTGDSDPDDEFHQTIATNRAAAAATGNIFLVTDTDTAFDPDWVHNAVALVENDAAPWLLPKRYHRLTQPASDRILAGPPEASPIRIGKTEWTGTSSWAGLVVLTRSAYETVGGFDERLLGWSPCDIVFGLSLTALVGRQRRLAGDAYHLWHGTDLADTWGNDHYLESRVLADRYHAAVDDPDAMRALIAERTAT